MGVQENLDPGLWSSQQETTNRPDTKYLVAGRPQASPEFGATGASQVALT